MNVAGFWSGHFCKIGSNGGTWSIIPLQWKKGKGLKEICWTDWNQRSEVGRIYVISTNRIFEWCMNYVEYHLLWYLLWNSFKIRQETGIPQEIVDRAAALSAKPNAIQDLISSMTKLSNSFHEVESLLNEMEDLLKVSSHYYPILTDEISPQFGIYNIEWSKTNRF